MEVTDRATSVKEKSAHETLLYQKQDLSDYLYNWVSKRSGSHFTGGKSVA